MQSLRLATVLMALVTSACGIRPARSSFSSTGAESELPRPAILEFAGTNALQLIQRERPLWLQTRGPVSTVGRQGVQVYRDGMWLGGLGELRQMSLHGIRRIIRYSASEATIRFGAGNPHGAIEVVTMDRLLR